MDLIDKVDDLTQQVKLHFSNLHSGQINWKPEQNQWSIGQCLDHIIVTNTTYFNSFDQLSEGRYKLSLLQKINPFKKTFGPMMIKSLGPQAEKKFKAPKIFEPSFAGTGDKIVTDFIEHQEVLKNYFNKLKQPAISKTVIASPVSSMITYSVADAMQIITGHEQRHINQAIRILNHPNFPTS